jgi:integrase
MKLSAAWQDGLDGYELHSLSAAPRSVRKRLADVRIMAKHTTVDGLEPEAVTKVWLTKYVLAQVKGRKGAGAVTLYQNLRSFWLWFAAAYELPNPYAGIDRPKGKAALVPVPTEADIEAILKACAGRSPAETARNRALVWLMLESGIRRSELSALDTDDIDLKARTVTIRNGKGGKARLATFGDETSAALWQWLRKRGKEPGPLFTARLGGRLSPGGINMLTSRPRGCTRDHNQPSRGGETHPEISALMDRHPGMFGHPFGGEDVAAHHGGSESHRPLSRAERERARRAARPGHTSGRHY